MNVLLVEDSSLIQDRLVVLLAELKEITIIGQAHDVPEAIAAIQQSKPDIMVLDICIPGGSGFDVLEYIKKNHLAIKVAILTNYPYPQYRQRCQELGADFFFDKSVDFDKMVTIMKQFAAKEVKHELN